LQKWVILLLLFSNGRLLRYDVPVWPRVQKTILFKRSSDADPSSFAPRAGLIILILFQVIMLIYWLVWNETIILSQFKKFNCPHSSLFSCRCFMSWWHPPWSILTSGLAPLRYDHLHLYGTWIIQKSHDWWDCVLSKKRRYRKRKLTRKKERYLSSQFSLFPFASSTSSPGIVVGCESPPAMLHLLLLAV
jgi:hypothetical protein